ncbi:MAG: hypothetical protein JWN94_715 [Betaproteobacteria bacterium]|nr:hypothetical protein [Betaproteobacteria bacterium]
MQTPDLKGFRFQLRHSTTAISSALPAALLALLLLATGTAQAQFRTLPENAKRATVGTQQYSLPYIDIGGKQLKLAPGGLIYDENNRTIVHAALPPGADVAVVPDMNGDIGRIYILTPAEQAKFGQK